MKPTDSLLKALIAAHGIIHCHAAITWQAISCTGVTVDGASIDDIWDNTRALAQNAISQIDSLINAPRLVPKVGDVSRIGFNAQAMWNINVQTKFWKSLPSSDQAILRRAQTGYNAILGAMAPSQDYFFCNDDALVLEQIDTNPVTNNPTKGYVYKPEGTSDRLIFNSYYGASDPPCSDTGLMAFRYKGTYQTFDDSVTPTAVTEREVSGILFCAVNFERDNRKGILRLGYPTTAEEGEVAPDPDHYASASGGVLHELMHHADAVYKDQTVSRGTGLGNMIAYNYIGAHTLARSGTLLFLENPDNYRVFAEMSMSPGTRWGPPKPL